MTNPLPSEPARRLAIVTCMDARLDPWGIFGVGRGDAHVIRNAGGVVTDDVIRSLAISQRLLGTEEIALVLHTGCGMTTFTDDDFRSRLEADTGLRPTWSAETFTDVEAEVIHGMARIDSSPFIDHKQALRGYVWDVASGELHEVSAPTREAGNDGGPPAAEGPPVLRAVRDAD